MSAEKINVEIKKLDAELALPAYAYPGDAGLDLCSAEDATLAPFERKLIPTGIAVAIPHGYAGFVLPRSGLALRSGLSLVNAPGLIDSQYRGEIKVIAINLDAHEPLCIQRGERIAQLMVVAYPHTTLVEVGELENTERGSGGFGSSGSASSSTASSSTASSDTASSGTASSNSQ
jgi:dUTP pyrophosphatase